MSFELVTWLGAQSGVMVSHVGLVLLNEDEVG